MGTCIFWIIKSIFKLNLLICSVNILLSYLPADWNLCIIKKKQSNSDYRYHMSHSTHIIGAAGAERLVVILNLNASVINRWICKKC